MKLLEATLERKRAKTEGEVEEIFSLEAQHLLNTAVERLRVGKHKGTVLKCPQPFLRVEMEAMVLAAGPGVHELISWNDNRDLGGSYMLLRSVGEQNLRDYLIYEDAPPLPGTTSAEITRQKANGRLVREGLLYQLFVILRRIHAAGIMHGDVDARHVVLSGAGAVTGFSEEVRIVDFSGSMIAPSARGGQADPKAPLPVAYTKEGRRDNLDPFVTMGTILGRAGCGSGKSDGKLRDMYAFGVLALRLFDSDIFHKKPVGMPAGLENFVNGVTTLDPTERFAPHAELERHPWVEEMSAWTDFKQGRISESERQRRISEIDAVGLVPLDMLVTEENARASRAATPNVDCVFQYLTLPLPNNQGSQAARATRSTRAEAAVAAQHVGAVVSPATTVAPYAARRRSDVSSRKGKPRGEGEATARAAVLGLKRRTEGDSLAAPAKRRKGATGGVLYDAQDAEREAPSAVTNSGVAPVVVAAAGPAGPVLNRGAAQSMNLERLAVGATKGEDVEMSPKGSDVEGDGLAAAAATGEAAAAAAAAATDEAAAAAAVAMSYSDNATENKKPTETSSFTELPSSNGSSAVGGADAVQESGAAPWNYGGGYGRAAVTAAGVSLHKSLLKIFSGKVG